MNWRQVTRWLAVGVATNGCLYLAYIALTRSMLGPKKAMTVVYVAGVLIGFAGHRAWTFEHAGRVDAALIRYLAVYGLGYVFNLAGLEIGVSILQLPHELVQGGMIVTIAIMMFLMQRHFVFAELGPNVGTTDRTDV